MEKVFLVFAKDSVIKKEDVLSNCTLIQEKFSFTAFFLTLFWLLYHRLWGWTAFYISIIIISFLYVTGFISESLKIFTILATSFYMGIFSSTILQKKLIKKGYSLKSVILANSRESALSRLLLFLKIEKHTSKDMAYTTKV